MSAERYAFGNTNVGKILGLCKFITQNLEEQMKEERFAIN